MSGVAVTAYRHRELPHHGALADAEACAWIIIDAAKRHGAASLAELGATAGARISHLAAVAA